MLICVWLHRRADGWVWIDGGNYSWYVMRSFAYGCIGELTAGCGLMVETIVCTLRAHLRMAALES